MRRINFKFLLILIVGAGVALGAALVINRFQVSAKAGTKLVLARKLKEEGKAFQATDLLAQYVNLRPDDDDAFAEYSELLLARALAGDATRNDVARAYAAMETAVRRNPDDDQLRRRLAEFQLRVGRPTDAREHLEVLAERVAKRPAATTGPAAESASAGDSKPGAGDDEKPLTADDIQLLLARCYLGSSEMEKAGGILAKLVGYDLEARRFADEPPAAEAPAEAYVMLAAILEDRFNAPEAANDVLQELTVRRGDDVMSWLAMSQWHRQQGDLVAAATDVTRALAIAPDDANCLFADFELALAQADFERARRAAARARELFPTDERVYRGLAAVATQVGDLPTAEQVLLDGVEAVPGRASLLLMLTDTLLQQNKLEEARQQIARIGDLYGTTSGPVGLLEARLLVAERRWRDAKEKLEATRPLVLGNLELVRQVDLYLAQCHAQLDEPDAQLDVSRRVLTDDPGSLAARAGAAQALLAAGRNDEALAEFETIALGLPPDRLAEIPQVWFPLLQLRLATQAALPPAQRDWSGVDSLLDALQQSATISASQLALLRSESLVRRGDAATARELLERTAAESKEPQIWAALASLALREGGPDAARDVLTRRPAEIADDPALLGIEAQLAAREPGDKAVSALRGIEERAKRLPATESTRVLETLAGVHLGLDDKTTAERLWGEVAKLEPDNIRVREAQLELAIAAEDATKARQAAAEVDRVAGESSARSRAADAAVDILEARLLLRKRPESETGPDPAVERLLTDARNRLIEAENDRPGWSQVQVLFADVEGLRGNIGGAIDRLKRAVALGPLNPAVVRRLVSLLFSANRLEEAQQAMAMLGSDGTAGFERISAEVELRAGKFDEAVALAERSVSGDTQDPEDLLWLGQLLARSGRQQQAAATFDRAAELAPEMPDVWLALFSHRLATGAPGPATTALEKAASLMAEPRRQLVLAEGYEMLGRVSDAERLLREATAAMPADATVLRSVAGFDLRRSSPAQAREALQRILALDDDSPTTVDAQAWARRSLAEVTARGGTYRQLKEALQTLREGDQPPTGDDLALEISLLSARPEPVSWREAIDRIRELGRLQPLTTGQRLTLAQLLERSGQWAEGRNELVAIVAGPETPSAYVAMLVEKLIDHGETTTAATWLRRLRQKSPDAPITLALEAKLAMAEKDRERAVSFAKRLMPDGDVAGNTPAQLRAIGRLMEDLGFGKAADRVFEKFAAVSLEGAIARVEFLARQGRSAEALDLLEQRWDELSLERALGLAVEVARSAPDDSVAAAVARVEPWVAKGARLDPGSVVVGLLGVELAALAGREDDVEAMYRRLLDRSDLTPPQVAIVANNLAFHMARPETAAEARRLIDSAIEELGPLPDLLDTRGLVRLAQDDATGAVEDLREAVLEPSDVKFLHLATAQLAVGDSDAARRALAEARQRGLGRVRLSRVDQVRLRKLEEALGPGPETAADAGG